MKGITVKFLKEVLDNVPDEFVLCYENKTVNTDFTADKIEIDAKEKKVIVK